MGRALHVSMASSRITSSPDQPPGQPSTSTVSYEQPTSVTEAQACSYGRTLAREVSMLQLLVFTVVCGVSLLVPYWFPRIGLALGSVLLALGVRWSAFAYPDEWLGLTIRPEHGVVAVVVASAWIALALGVLLYRHLMRFARPV
jgi:hypothetical protein